MAEQHSLLLVKEQFIKLILPQHYKEALKGFKAHMHLFYILPWTNLFLLHVEVLDDDTDEEVQSEERSNDYKEHKEEIIARCIVVHRLLFKLQWTKDIQIYDEGALLSAFQYITYVCYIHRIGHNLDPPLKGCLSLKKR